MTLAQTCTLSLSLSLSLSLLSAFLTRAQAYECCFADCYLDGEKDTIDEEMLALLERGFAKLRAAGVKALLRFAYDRCPHGDAGEGNYTASSEKNGLRAVRS